MSVGVYMCFPYLLLVLKIKKALASGMGTAFSFSWMSESGRGRGPTGISGSSSSSSPAKKNKQKRIFEKNKNKKKSHHPSTMSCSLENVVNLGKINSKEEIFSQLKNNSHRVLPELNKTGLGSSVELLLTVTSVF